MGIQMSLFEIVKLADFEEDESDKAIIELSWENNGSHGVMIVVKKGGAVDAIPNNETTYTADPRFGYGDELGSGNYVVYRSTDSNTNSMKITNLEQFVTYHIRGFAFDDGTFYESTTTEDDSNIINNPISTATACVTSDTLVTMFDGTYKSIKNIQSGDMLLDGQLNAKKIVSVLKFTKHDDVIMSIIPVDTFTKNVPYKDLTIAQSHPVSSIIACTDNDINDISFNRNRKIRLNSLDKCKMLRVREHAKMFKNIGISSRDKQIHELFNLILETEYDDNLKPKYSCGTFIANGVIIESLSNDPIYDWKSKSV